MICRNRSFYSKHIRWIIGLSKKITSFTSSRISKIKLSVPYPVLLIIEKHFQQKDTLHTSLYIQCFVTISMAHLKFFTNYLSWMQNSFFLITWIFDKENYKVSKSFRYRYAVLRNKSTKKTNTQTLVPKIFCLYAV